MLKEPHFDISVDVPHSLLRITICGFFDEGIFADYVTSLAAAYPRLRCAPNQHVTLIDVSKAELKSQSMVDRMSAMISNPRTASRRLAFVVTGSLARMQVRRMIKRSNVELFDNISAAEAWLFAA